MAIKKGDRIQVRDYRNDDDWTDAIVKILGPKTFVADIGGDELVFNYYEHKESWVKDSDGGGQR